MGKQAGQCSRTSISNVPIRGPIGREVHRQATGNAGGIEAERVDGHAKRSVAADLVLAANADEIVAADVIKAGSAGHSDGARNVKVHPLVTTARVKLPTVTDAHADLAGRAIFAVDDFRSEVEVAFCADDQRRAYGHVNACEHSFGHDLLTIPTKSMKPGEEEYSIGCIVPVNAEGVKIINTTYAPRHEDVRAFPVSGAHHYPEGFVIFDDVFVPTERIFLDGETAYAATFAHSLGLWERLGGLSAFVEEADQLVGLAQLVAEANGTAGISHIKEKISEMIIHATLIRASLEAAISNCNIGPEGAAFPNELFTNAGKFHAAANYNQMVRHLHDIAGGAVLTAPVPADFENAEVGHLARKYMATSDSVDGEYRSRLMHTIRDLTADSYGGWKFVTNLQAGGGLYAQRIVTRRHYDLDGAKRKAMALTGLDEDGHERPHGH